MRTFFFAIIFIPLLSMKPLFAQVEDGVDIRKVQRVLTTLCYKPGPIDGLWGKQTANAVTEFLADEKKEYNGNLDKSEAEFIFTRAAVINGSGKSKKCKVAASKKNNSPTVTGYATSFGRSLSYKIVNGVTIYDRWEIPEYVNPAPNLPTLRHYLKKYLNASENSRKYTISASSRPRQLTYEIEENQYLNDQMATTSLLSYLFYERGKIIHHGHSPKDRFGDIYPRNAVYHSNSMGKSIVSYILGHAICEGYIRSVDDTISDWPLMQGTLYSEQKLIDLLNMTARDKHVVSDFTGVKPTGRWYNSYSLKNFAKNELAGTAPVGSKKYHYNGLVTNVIMNYTIYKTGRDYKKLLNKIFRDKIGISNRVYFLLNETNKLNDGSAWYMFNATPEDYLRIAISIMEDKQNETCVGDYLNLLDEQKVRKNLRELSPKLKFQASRSYGGQFHMNYKRMSKLDIIGLDGYGNQSILIDATNSRIVVTNSIHTDYDWDTLNYKAILRGKLPN